MTDDDLWLPTPTVMDATRHTVRGCWRPGENWRGVALVNAILDAGEIRIMGTHTTGMSENELPGTPNCMDMLPPHADAERPRAGKGAGYRNLRDDIDHLPTPTSNEWNGGTMVPERRAAMGHAVTVADWAEKSDDIDILPEARLFATPNRMDAIMPRSSTGDPREDAMMRNVTVLPTPTSRDGKGRNQRNSEDCMPVAADNMSITVPGPYHGGLWGLDDGRGVRFGRFTAAIRRWERVSGRPAPCPTQATGGLRRWVGANADDPTLFEPYWLARHAPFDAHPKARLDQPMRDRMLARWRETDRGMSLIDPMFWPGCKDMDPDIPIPATRLPDKSVLGYWKTRFEGPRFPSAAHLSPRFVEWMMGLEDGWVTNPAIWRHVDGNHRNLQLRALGNGVVPPQAAMAVDWALRVRERLAV